MSVVESHTNQEPSILESTLKRLTGNRATKARSAFDIHEMIERGMPSQGIIIDPAIRFYGWTRPPAVTDMVAASLHP